MNDYKIFFCRKNPILSSVNAGITFSNSTQYSHERTLYHRHRSGSARAVARREQDVLRLQHQIRRPPNTQTCPVCIGMPGTLPVMNRKAFELSLKTAIALNCAIPHFTKWDRKNYYYPDLPKGYQISQFDLPLSHDGYLTISGKGVRNLCRKGS